MKRKYFYRTAVLSLAVLVSAIFGTSSYNANAAPINHSIHVNGTSLLKVNDYDVFYCTPIGPYVNEENVSWFRFVPLPSFLAQKLIITVNFRKQKSGGGQMKLCFKRE
ncbi:hypothetical protein [Paenibacillus polymyxa]|uniref:hypothetical protein n=1 Tax=Paenibacillus polymyxa TaxID=1406 RepID=UPI001E5183C3|nr:hypothetical protein [Paenibacillus polymyxa]